MKSIVSQNMANLPLFHLPNRLDFSICLSPFSLNTPSLVTLSSQLIFSILLHIHISKAFNLILSASTSTSREILGCCNFGCDCEICVYKFIHLISSLFVELTVRCCHSSGEVKNLRNKTAIEFVKVGATLRLRWITKIARTRTRTHTHTRTHEHFTDSIGREARKLIWPVERSGLFADRRRSVEKQRHVRAKGQFILMQRLSARVTGSESSKIQRQREWTAAKEWRLGGVT